MLGANRHLARRCTVALAAGCVTCAVPVAAQGATVASPAKLTLQLIRHAQRAAAAAPHTGAVSVPIVAPSASAVPASGGASIAPPALPHRVAAPRSASRHPRHARPERSHWAPVQPTPSPIKLPIPIVRVPRGQANIVVIIRINSPGNDGPITQVNKTSVTVAPQATPVHQSCGALRLSSGANRASAAMSWATRCAAAIRAADPHASVAITRAPRHHPNRPAVRSHLVPAAHPPPSFVPLRPMVPHAPPERRVIAAHAHHQAPRAHRSVLGRPAPSDPPSDWLPSAPGPAASFAPAGGQGGTVVGLLAIICLTMLPGMIGRYASPRSVLRETLRASRLERPG